MSTYNIDFYEDLTKIIFQLSSNTHLISSFENGQNLQQLFCDIQSETQHYEQLRIEITILRLYRVMKNISLV